VGAEGCVTLLGKERARERERERERETEEVDEHNLVCECSQG
jgi:hypothetical protein